MTPKIYPIPKVMPFKLFLDHPNPALDIPGRSKYSQFFDANSTTHLDNPTGFSSVFHLISFSTRVVTLSLGGLDTIDNQKSLEMDYLEDVDLKALCSWVHVTTFFPEHFYTIGYNLKNARNGKSASKIPKRPSLKPLE